MSSSYYYGARYYDPRTSVFYGIDPKADSFPSWSPYTYCLNNPIRFIDPDGMGPGDLFTSTKSAAKDWGRTYNGRSINSGTELGSKIYQVKVNGKLRYTYTPATSGGNDGTNTGKAPKGTKTVADIHSHGKYEKGYLNNDFSTKDKADNVLKKIDGYLTTPDGSLKKYDVETQKTSTLATDLPFDPQNPPSKDSSPPRVPTKTKMGKPAYILIPKEWDK